MDWDKLKREYVTTDISQRKLAKKYDIPYSNLSRMATKDKWSDARTQFKSRVNAKSLAKAEAKATDYKSFLYDIAYRVAGQLNDLINEYGIAQLIALGVTPKDLTGAIKELEDALRRSGHALQHVRHLRELLDGPGEVLDILDEGLNITNRQSFMDCQITTKHTDTNITGIGDEACDRLHDTGHEL